MMVLYISNEYVYKLKMFMKGKEGIRIINIYLSLKYSGKNGLRVWNRIRV